MAEFASLIIELAKCFVDPISRRFMYFYRSPENIRCLVNDEARKLKDAIDGMQMKVDEDEGNGRRILPHIRTWLTEAIAAQEKVNDIKNKSTNVSCMNIKSRYVLGKKSVKTIETIEKILENGISSSEQISVPRPPPIIPVIINLGKEFESRKGVIEDIILALKDKNITIIGICGLGGVGKTTMAEGIMNRVISEKLMDKAMKIVIGQQITMSKTQADVAEFLGDKLGKESLRGRAEEICNRFQNLEGTLLIVIDDVWKKFNLEDIGISLNIIKEKCKIIFTSRDETICRDMGAQRSFRVDVLSKKEARDLFSEKAGSCVNYSNINSLAKDICRECNGLPIALVTVGTTLKDEKSESVWQHALDELRKANPEDISYVLSDVYNPLKLSYSYLQSDHAKSLFLLCSMFPEDYDIPLDHLNVYCVGLRLFDEVMNMKEAGNKVHALLQTLKSRFLLLDGEKKECVKMHDVVRDMAIYVASREERKFSISLDCMDKFTENSNRNCVWISLIAQSKILEFPMDLCFPDLRLLMTREIDFKEEAGVMDSETNYFDGMAKLNVLCIEKSNIVTLSSSFNTLQNLRALRLFECVNICNISLVGRLINLEIFCCHGCKKIEEVPLELKNLSRLRSLEMNDCPNLTRISPGVISSLTSLEELKMRYNSFTGWETEIENQTNVSLKELECLTNLTCLHISLRNLDLAATQIHLSSKLEKFYIGLFEDTSLDIAYNTSIVLKMEKPVNLASWVRNLLSRTEKICIKGDNKYNADFNLFQKVKYFKLKNICNIRNLSYLSMSGNHLQLERLEVEDCQNIEEIFTYNGGLNDQFVFPRLKYMKLYNLSTLYALCYGLLCLEFPELTSMEIIDCPKLTKLVSDQQTHTYELFDKVSFPLLEVLKVRNMSLVTHMWKNSFNVPNALRDISINNCNNIKSLFLLSMTKNLSNLEQIEISRCEKLEEIFLDDDDDQRDEIYHLVLPKLKNIEIQQLPNLISFSSNVQYIEFPQLIKLDIRNCNKMESFAGCLQENDEGFFNQKVSFPVLKYLFVFIMDSRTHLWKSSFPVPTTLEEIYISRCDNIKNLFLLSMAKNLSELQDITIIKCRKLEEIFIEDNEQSDVKYHLVLPKLETIKIVDLPSLISFSSKDRHIEFPQLRRIVVESCEKIASYGCGLLDEFLNEKVQVTQLQEIELKSNNVRLLWNQPPLSFFRQLKLLCIVSENKITELFSPSTAYALQNLQKLVITKCLELTDIITNMVEEVDENDEDKEADENGNDYENKDDEDVICLFPSLKFLNLSGIPNLKTFCPWKHVKLSALESVQIFGCREMKTFTGPNQSRRYTVITPKLKYIKINYCEFRTKEDLKEDLNVILQEHNNDPAFNLHYSMMFSS